MSANVIADGVKYDDASWHSDGNFPTDLSNDNGGTHIGFFLTWALLSGLGGEFHELELAAEFARLKSRKDTPRKYLYNCCDGKITDEDLNETGNRFTTHYYESQYFEDYASVFGSEYPTLYHVEDEWQNFDQLKLVLDGRYRKWTK